MLLIGSTVYVHLGSIMYLIFIIYVTLCASPLGLSAKFWH